MQLMEIKNSLWKEDSLINGIFEFLFIKKKILTNKHYFMKHFFYLLTVVATALIISSCGGKQESLKDPQINAKIKVEIGHIAMMSAVALSPVTNQVAASSYDESLILWDYDTKHQIWAYRPDRQSNSSNLTRLLYTSDGKKIVAGASGYVAIFDAKTGAVIKKIEVDKYNGKNLSLTSDDKLIAVGSNDSNIYLIDINSGSVSKTLSGHTNIVKDVDFSEDGKYLASASYDSTAIIWEVETGKIVKKVDAKDDLQYVAITTKANKFAFYAPDLDELYIWDLEKMKPINTLEDVFTLDLMFRGENIMITTFATTEEIDINTGKSLKTIKDYCASMSLIRHKMASVGGRGVEIYNYDNGKLIAEFGKDTRMVQGIKSSKSGRFIVTANTHKDGLGGPDLLSYPVDTNYNFSAYGTSGMSKAFFDFSGNKDVIFCNESGNDSYYYDLKTGKAISEIKGIRSPINITNDGTLLLTKDAENNYGIYDAKTGQLKNKLINSGAHVYFAGITPDDKYYILLTMDFCKVFELPSGKEVKSYKREDMDDIVFVDISKDGKYVVGRADNTFKLVDILTGEVLFLVKNTQAKNAAFNKDKNTLAIACDDWTIKIFDIAKNAQTQNLEGHGRSVESVAYTPDGKYLMSAAGDGKMKIWDLKGKLLLTLVGLEKTSDYEGETKDFVVFAPNGRYDGTEAGIEKFIYFEENGQRKPAKDFKDKCYTPNLLGRTLGQNFINENK